MNDMMRKSWVEVDPDSDFPLWNLPFGIYKYNNKPPRPATRIGDTVIDLYVLDQFGFFKTLKLPPQGIFDQPVLNPFLALGKKYWQGLREILLDLFEENNPALRDNLKAKTEALKPAGKLSMLLPVQPGDYTDFYSSLEHASNVGSMFRDPKNPLLPNWRHLPVGYHGRSSSIVVSGTPIHRPRGQVLPAGQTQPVLAPSRALDFELEMAFVTGLANELGKAVPVEEAEDHIFGLMIFNDLSARDIQRWEYVPLGPFLSKSFGSVVSPWIVTLDALEPFRTAGPPQAPKVLPYLRTEGRKHFDIQLEVFLAAEGRKPAKICTSNHR